MRRFLVLVCLCFASLSAFAQAPALPKMTWIRNYQVERGKEAEFMRLVKETFTPVLNELQKNGKILTWGVAVPITINEDPWTHVLYMSMPDWSGVEALDQAIDKAQASMTPEMARRSMELGMSVADERDVILRHIVQSATPPASKPKYIVADVHKVKPGREGDAVALFNEWAKPMFTDLAARGHVDFWGFSSHGVAVGLTGDADWTHMVWYFLHDLGAMEEVIAANEKVEPRTMQGYWVRLRDMSDIGARREQVWRIIAP
jgi:hypothetical protein